MDVVDAGTRSRMMSGIRSRNTKPEFAVRRALHGAGLRYRLDDRSLPGRPDLVFPRYRAVIFVNGCFWHAHGGCRYFKLPATRREFWRDKLQSNAARDSANLDALRALGWRVAVVWECALRAGVELGPLADWVRGGTSPTFELSAKT
jgi:DNA mismatch endonuclease (patch repair protein)